MSSRLIDYVCQNYEHVAIELLAQLTGLSSLEIQHIIETTG